MGNFGDNGWSWGLGDFDGGVIDNSGFGDRVEFSEGGNNDSSVGFGYWRSSLGNNNFGGSNFDDGGSGGLGYFDSRVIDDSGFSDRVEGSEGGVDDFIGSFGYGRVSFGNYNCCGFDGFDGVGGGVGGGVCVIRFGVGFGDGVDGSVGYDNFGDYGFLFFIVGDVGVKGGGCEGEEGKSCFYVDWVSGDINSDWLVCSEGCRRWK